MLHRIDIQPGKATKQLKHHTFHMPTCIYKFSILHRYTNDYHSIAQICRLVRDIDFELTICIKQTYNPTNLQLMPNDCQDIFTLIIHTTYSICHMLAMISLN